MLSSPQTSHSLIDNSCFFTGVIFGRSPAGCYSPSSGVRFSSVRSGSAPLSGHPSALPNFLFLPSGSFPSCVSVPGVVVAHYHHPRASSISSTTRRCRLLQGCHSRCTGMCNFSDNHKFYCIYLTIRDEKSGFLKNTPYWRDKQRNVINNLPCVVVTGAFNICVFNLISLWSFDLDLS